MSTKCTDFRPHHLRPEKCRNCFGDMSQHQSVNSSPTTSEQQAGQHQQQGRNSSDKPTTMIDNCDDSEIVLSDYPKVNELTREQLIGELKKCHEEKTKLAERMQTKRNSVDIERGQLIESYKKETERLKVQLVGAESGAGVVDGSAKCDKCGLNLGEVKRLAGELEELKSSYRLAETERDQARDELRALEREMEEMHDNFKEEESEQFEQVKQELDLAMKNIKILQIRLNKSERQYGQLEQVKSMLEHQLEESGSRRQQSSEMTTTATSSFMQIGPDSVKLSTCEYDQLLRDLNDTIEREKDLQEQIKYSQEEAQLTSDRLQAVEAENEVLLNKVNKLTLANSKFRTNQLSAAQRRSTSMERADSDSGHNQQQQQVEETRQQQQTSDNNATCDMIEQNEQLKLALELAQSECDRLKRKWQDTVSLVDKKEDALKEFESKRAKLEEELARLKALRRANSQEQTGADEVSKTHQTEHLARVELECRQLRTKLVHSERDCKQLKAQLEMSASGRQSRTGEHLSATRTMKSSQSMESSGEQAKYKELNRQLRAELDSLRAHNIELEKRLEILNTNQGVGQTLMESDLLEKLKRQLDVSESELAKAKSRLVEMDIECGRAQRQYKRLVESIESGDFGGGQIGRKVKLPAESLRDSMSRQELRQAIKDLEEELDECVALIRSKDCLLREQQISQSEASGDVSAGGDVSPGKATTNSSSTSEEQVKSLRRLLDQERLLSNNLKIDVGNLDQVKQELQMSNRMFERERIAMEEELEKQRQVIYELTSNLEEAKESQWATSNRLKELQVNCEKLRSELAAQSRSNGQSASSRVDESQQMGHSGQQSGSSADLLLLARDLSELKVKNGFLMRQLEIAREDTSRQLEDLRQASEAQQRRAVELAQIDLKERQFGETQQLRDELNELKQKLAVCQRQAARNEEEASGERDRVRSMERDWRRDKSQWQQRVEQLEAQLSIERRSNEYKVKECESVVRDKERELIGMQDKYVQLERDFKRLQNKYNLLEENSDSRQRNLIRDLEIKKRELSELIAGNQMREEEYYENCKRFNSEKATLLEALESIKRSYDEKLAELKSIKELVMLRQDQSYKERLSAQEKIDTLSGQLIKMGEHETQAKLLRQQLQLQEKQIDALKRDHLQMKEDRLRLKTKCDDLERRCLQYEKQELISKTTSISSSTNSFLKARNPFYSSKESAKKPHEQHSVSSRTKVTTGGQKQHEPIAGDDQQQQQQQQLDGEQQRKSQCLMVEKLSSKINDQRHLINMLKQQHDETQMELKQLKLVQASEKSKWQSRLAQLTGRLNECEEKLLFESSLVTNQETFESSRRKLEVKWADERRATLEMVQQQQAQNEMLMKDLKKLSQSHDLLRLQSKQLEAHNNKLSRKLIEYQQQTESAGGFTKGSHSGEAEQVGRELEQCVSERQRLLLRQDELLRLNSKLVSVMREEARPLLETVGKICVALDSTSTEQPIGSTSKQTSDQEEASKSNSRLRPLMTTRRQSSEDCDTSPGQDLTSSSGHHQHQSRLSRLLCKQPKTGGSESASEQTTASKPATSQLSSPSKGSTKCVKRVRVKSSSLGITSNEKKLLRRHLEELTCALDRLNAEQVSLVQRHATTIPSNERSSSERTIVVANSPNNQYSHQCRASSETIDRSASHAQPDLLTAGDRPSRGLSYTPSRRVEPHSSESPQSQRVHWQRADSDLDSEQSFAGDRSAHRSSDVYRRFPQTTPASYSGGGASLTDYESESSLASDYSYSYPSGGQLQGPTRRPFVCGTESDSCVGQTVSGPKLAKQVGKKRGLKVRLTSTLRNISRSISGLASDSEADLQQSELKKAAHKRRHPTGDTSIAVAASATKPIATSKQGEQDGTLREIRV